jgi:hypothetical protein
MKTTKFFTILSLAMIFVCANTVYSNNSLSDKPQMTKKINIKYEVIVILNSPIELCNIYYIQVTDETGRLIAPPKIFDPSKQKYVFTEDGPAKGKLRVAMLVMATDVDPYLCPVHIGARPDVKFGPFLLDETYSFVLRPLVKAPIDKE